MAYYDLFLPSMNLDTSLDSLSSKIGAIYQEAWTAEHKALFNDKPFDLHVNLFADLWFGKQLRLFMAYDDTTHEPIGFLIGILFRPMQYKAGILQIDDWYTRGDKEVERGLFKYVAEALRYIGCDEAWIVNDKGIPPLVEPLGDSWKLTGQHTIQRFSAK